MQARKNAKGSTTSVRKSKPKAKKASPARVKAKSSPSKAPAKKKVSTKAKASPVKKGTPKKGTPKKRAAKPAARLEARSAGGSANKTPRSTNGKGKTARDADESAMHESKPQDAAASSSEVLQSHAEPSREPVRGGDHDLAKHSKPEVQIERRHLQTLRGPERRATLRGH